MKGRDLTIREVCFVILQSGRQMDDRARGWSGTISAATYAATYRMWRRQTVAQNEFCMNLTLLATREPGCLQPDIFAFRGGSTDGNLPQQTVATVAITSSGTRYAGGYQRGIPYPPVVSGGKT